MSFKIGDFVGYCEGEDSAEEYIGQIISISKGKDDKSIYLSRDENGFEIEDGPGCHDGWHGSFYLIPNEEVVARRLRSKITKIISHIPSRWEIMYGVHNHYKKVGKNLEQGKKEQDQDRKYYATTHIDEVDKLMKTWLSYNFSDRHFVDWVKDFYTLANREITI